MGTGHVGYELNKKELSFKPVLQVFFLLNLLYFLRDLPVPVSLYGLLDI
jgi:hypothetical protein